MDPRGKSSPIRSILVANRGEIALRIFRTCESLGIRTSTVASRVDSDHPHARQAGRTSIVGDSPREVYLNGEAIVRAALELRADAIHPGYGYLSENPAFARLVEEAGLVFLGPSAETLTLLGEKHTARELALRENVSISPGFHETCIDDSQLIAASEQLGFPLMIKAVAGGGGRGMRRVASASALPDSISEARSEALRAFGDARLLLERLVERARHVEVQLLGDGLGDAIAFGERDCSLQRRYQKVVEESPAPDLCDEIRRELHDAAIRLAKAAKLRSLATAEFLLLHPNDRSTFGANYVFLEVNGRLQVEHPVTELVHGVDLVACQIQIGEGKGIEPSWRSSEPAGHAIELRIYAESPRNDFAPSIGLLRGVELPVAPGIRIDHILATGEEVTTDFDSMIGKMIGYGENRLQSVTRLQSALSCTRVEGVDTNVSLLSDMLGHARFAGVEYDTGSFAAILDELRALQSSLSYAAAAVSVFQMFQIGSNHSGSQTPKTRDPFVYLRNRTTESLEAELAVPAITLHVWGSLSHRKLEVTRIAIDPLLDRAALTIDGQPLQLEREGETRYSINGELLEVSEERRLYSARWKQRLIVDGLWFDVETTLPQASAASTTNVDSPTIRAQIPGKVTRILIHEGERVRPGTVLLHLDSMKIEHAIHLHEAGLIESIQVKEGESVRAGAELIRYRRMSRDEEAD